VTIQIFSHCYIKLRQFCLVPVKHVSIKGARSAETNNVKFGRDKYCYSHVLGIDIYGFKKQARCLESL
jgi:hypothetical protein